MNPYKIKAFWYSLLTASVWVFKVRVLARQPIFFQGVKAFGLTQKRMNSSKRASYDYDIIARSYSPPCIDMCCLVTEINAVAKEFTNGSHIVRFYPDVHLHG